MSGLAALHLIILGLWGGVVAVETVFEVAGARGRLPAEAVARLHVWTDRYLELPILAGVLSTGLLLWERSGWSRELLPKILLGLVAIGANLVCFSLVERRGAAAAPTRSHTTAILVVAMPGVLAAVGAVYLGGSRAGWW